MEVGQRYQIHDFAVKFLLVDLGPRRAEWVDGFVEVILAVNSAQGVGAASPSSTVQGWAWVVAGGVLSAADAASGILVLENCYELSRFAAIAALGAGSGREVLF